MNGHVGLGLVGCGASRFMYGPVIRFMQKGRFIACADVDEAKAKAFANEYGIPRVYGDVAEVLRDTDVRGVVLATPPSLHPQHTVMAARAGKHVFCEKPMARTMVDCHRLICPKSTIERGAPHDCLSK